MIRTQKIVESFFWTPKTLSSPRRQLSLFPLLLLIFCYTLVPSRNLATFFPLLYGLLSSYIVTISTTKKAYPLDFLHFIIQQELISTKRQR